MKVNDISGKTFLFFSFEIENPKSSDSYLSSRSVRDVVKRAETAYDIIRPSTGQNEVVYLSVKGVDVSNEFQLTVAEKNTNNSQISLHRFEMLGLLMNLFFSSFLII